MDIRIRFDSVDINSRNHPCWCVWDDLHHVVRPMSQRWTKWGLSILIRIDIYIYIYILMFQPRYIILRKIGTQIKFRHIDITVYRFGWLLCRPVSDKCCQWKPDKQHISYLILPLMQSLIHWARRYKHSCATLIHDHIIVTDTYFDSIHIHIYPWWCNSSDHIPFAHLICSISL